MLKETLIPFHRPIKLQEEEKTQIMNKIDSCLTSGILTNNKNVMDFEERIREIHNTEYAIATSSCSQGLVIAIQSLINSTDKIPYHAYTQSFTWYSTPYAIKTCNRLPVYCDIYADTWTMKQEMDYKFAVPVHTFGNVSKIDSIFKIYDGAHCLGTKLDDIGDATVISLAPTKLITSIEGGIILTNYSKIAKYARELRDKVSRMSEIHAIFGNTYLNHIEEVTSFKKEVFNYYKKHLNGIFQKTPYSSNYNTIGMLTELKIPPHIETRKYYAPILSLTRTNDLPIAQSIYNRIVCLPSWFNCPYKKIVNDICNFNK